MPNKIMYFTNENPQVELLRHTGEDRRMKLLKSFSYIDANGDRWTAKAGCVVDGASIPKAFQWLIGSPLVGDYRNASIIHDYYCKIKTRPSEDVHACFCEMLEVLGLPKWKRSLMCFAVKTYGPKFDGK